MILPAENAPSDRTPADAAGIIRVQSLHTAVNTARRLETVIRERGLILFATIHLSEDAAQAGLPMRFTQLIVFGNPRGGTPVMIASPSRF